MKEDAKSKQPANGGFAEEFDRFVRTKFVDGGKRYTVSERCLLTAHHFADWQRQKDLDEALGGDALWVEHCNGYREGQADMKKKAGMLKDWFKDIARMCECLTPGNCSNLGELIRSLADRSAEFIDNDML